MTNIRKAWKLQECVAHSPGTVTCLSFGRKSGRVMATGGEDKKVNMWAVGKPSCIMSLSGHTSAVECIEFGLEEDKVVAGSQSGSIRIWDLEEVKLVRALSGHKAAVRSLDFHPYGNFVASGSLDATVKLWDINRKGCIYTYKGHTGCVNMLRFSPDGKWIVSSGEDGTIKLWDLSAGKQLTEFTDHNGPVTCVTFHPNVLLLASSSADRTVKLFDLETFQMVSTSLESDSPGPVRRVAFHPDGSCIYAASADMLKIYNAEATECLETVVVGWRTSGVADMAVAPSFNQLIGASISQSVVSTYVVDVKSCAPFVQPSPSEVKAVGERPFTQSSSGSGGGASSGRKSFYREPEQDRRSQPKEEARSDSPETGGDDAVGPAGDSVIQDPVEYVRVFHPKKTLQRSPPPEDMPFAPPPATQTNVEDVETARQPPPPPTERKVKPRATPTGGGGTSQTPQSRPETHAGSYQSRPTPVSPPGQEKAKVEIDDFLPKANVSPFSEHCLLGGPNPSSSTTAISEAEAVRRFREPHEQITQVLAARQKNLSTVRLMWSRDNIRTAVESAMLMNDQAVLVDILGVLVQNHHLWNLDLTAMLLPHLLKLIKAKYSTYVETACYTVKLIMKHFLSVIKQNLELQHGVGVDLTGEERQRKCQSCYSHLIAIRSQLEVKEVASKAGPVVRELQVMMQLLE